MGGCATTVFELTRIGIEPPLATSSEYLSGTLWSVTIPDAYGYEFESAKKTERFDMVNTNGKTLTRYNPLQKISFGLRPGEKKTYEMIFVSPVNVLGPGDADGNRNQNRVLAFCAKLVSDDDDVCVESFASIKLPLKSEDKISPVILFAGTSPENPNTGESASARVRASDDYRIKSVKFVVNGDETTKTFSQPNVTAISDVKMSSAGDRYRIEVLDWNDNKVCFPSDCASYANPKFGNYPDPYISSGSISRTSVTSPGELDVTLTVKNRGNVDVADFAFMIYLDNTLVALKSAFDTPLKSGDSDTEIITEDIVIPPEVSEGRHSITAEVVFDGDERDSGNNKRIASFSVTGSASSSTGTATTSTSASQGAVSETSGDYKLSISTDKESYVEGEKVILSGSLSRSSTAVSGASVIIVARNDASGISTREFVRTTDSIGRFSYVLNSNGAPAFGKWTIEASAIGGSVKVSKEIALSAATSDERTEMTMKTDKESYVEGDVVVVSGRSSGSTVSIQAINDGASKRTVVYETAVKSDGSYSFSFRTQGAALGTWRIVVKNASGDSAEKEVRLTS